MNKETRFWVLILFTVIAFRLALTAGLPICANSHASHDDDLYVRQGESIAAGHWLGPYNERTLLKGPMYPLFLAGSKILGIPLQTSQQLFHVAVCLLLLVALRPAVRNRWARLGLVSAVLFNPLSLGTGEFARVIREGIYSSLTIAVTACVLGWMVRIDTSRGRSWLWALAGGMFLGAFWITREEGPWILPLIVSALIYSVLKKKGGPGWVRFRQLTASFLLAGFGWSAVVGTVALVNKTRYGLSGVVEFKRREMLLAYGALSAVRPDRFRPRVIISKEDRKKVYAVSPAFRELEPFLEGRIGEAWTRNSETVYPDMPGEICGGWFVHALRDAVTAAGHAHTALEAMAFYDRIGREIREAGRQGKIDLFPIRQSMSPSWRREYASPLFKAWWKGWSLLGTLMKEDPIIYPSRGSDAGLDRFQRLIGTRLSGEFGVWRTARIRISAIDRPISLRVGIGGYDIAARFRWINRRGGPGREAGAVPTIPTGPPRRLSVSYSADYREAALVIYSENTFLQVFPLDGSIVAVKAGPLLFRIDGVEYDLPFRQGLENVRFGIIRILKKVYVLCLPALYLVLAAVFCFPWLRRRWIIDPVLSVMFIALLSATAARILLLAWIDATSFPGENLLYLAPVYPLLILAGGLVFGIQSQRSFGVEG